ncbi:hypothetical protein BLS_000487 [Venturia inaequalis]|uniref:Elongation factor methyltransferase 5 n=1 Tax=Venturia inaequalis TaxID=5025 RepID=A0A8H3UXL6_VENIN|nr:hypothetical protein BLS_000487 [Venturia inaequalis]
MSDSDSEPELSTAALTALKQFYTEKESRQKAFEDLKAVASTDFSTDSPSPSLKYPLSMEAFTEDWNASQFWYTDSTATRLATQLLQNSTPETRICVLSAPSVFLQLKNLLNEWPADKARPAAITLLEFDTRFAVFGDEFQYYDFKFPTKLPAGLKARFDVIILDPPFLSEDCQAKTAVTILHSTILVGQHLSGADTMRVFISFESTLHTAESQVRTTKQNISTQESKISSNE